MYTLIEWLLISIEKQAFIFPAILWFDIYVCQHEIVNYNVVEYY